MIAQTVSVLALGPGSSQIELSPCEDLMSTFLIALRLFLLFISFHLIAPAERCINRNGNHVLLKVNYLPGACRRIQLQNFNGSFIQFNAML